MAKGKKAFIRIEKASAVNREEINLLREIAKKFELDLSTARDFENKGPSTRVQECGSHSCLGHEDSDLPGDDRDRCQTESCGDQACNSHICSINSCDNQACSKNTCSSHEDSFQTVFSDMAKTSPALQLMQSITEELNTKDWGNISITVD